MLNKVLTLKIINACNEMIDNIHSQSTHLTVSERDIINILAAVVQILQGRLRMQDDIAKILTGSRPEIVVLDSLTEDEKGERQ